MPTGVRAAGNGRSASSTLERGIRPFHHAMPRMAALGCVRKPDRGAGRLLTPRKTAVQFGGAPAWRYAMDYAKPCRTRTRDRGGMKTCGGARGGATVVFLSGSAGR
jgi:hypothetical protein